MRTIDADALKRRAQKVATEAWKMELTAKIETLLNQFIDWINDAPTIEPERKTGTDNGCTFLTCKHGGFGDEACSKCRWAYRDMYEPDEERSRHEGGTG